MKLYINSYKPDSQLTWTKRDYLFAAAERLGIDSVMLYKGEPDAEHILNVEPFKDFVTGKKWTGIWEIDTMFDRPEMNMSNWIASDTVFIANTFVPQRMDAFQGVKVFLPQACDPILHKRTNIVPEYDFVFSGTIDLDSYIERRRTVELLRSEGFTFMDYPKDRAPHHYVEALSHARVQFVRSAKNHTGSSQVEQRFFECLALGPLLKDYHPALETFGLEEGKDFYWYKDDKEMLVKMHHLIDDPEFARKMAENGRRKALMHHTYEHRLMTILNLIREQTT